MVAAKLKKQLEPKAKERRNSKLKKGKSKPVPENLPERNGEPHQSESREQAAALLNVSGRSVEWNPWVPSDRISLARKREEILRPKAKANQSAAGGDKALSAILPKAPASSKVDTRKESAKVAGVGERTYDAGKLILDAGAVEVG